MRSVEAPVLTLFAIPKPFVGHIGMIQRNALASWVRLGAGSEVLVFGDEEGTADAAREVGARHLPELARNNRGTPLISDVFAQAARTASQSILVYANADMILTSDLPRALARVSHERFLLCGRRCNLSITAPLSFDAEWESRLRETAARDGELAIPGAIDWVAFPRHLFGALPPFAVGRPDWDQWLLDHARMLGAALIDATECVPAVHQNHDYQHLVQAPRAEVVEELAQNRDLALFHRLDIRDATHVLGPRGLRRTLDSPHLLRRMVALPKFYLPPTPLVRAAYEAWRRRFRRVWNPFTQ
jgi:hypothetical protein